MLGDMDVLAGKHVFQGVGDLLHILVSRQRDKDIEVTIHQLLGLAGDDILHLLDILHGNDITGGRNGGMTVLLLLQQGEFTLLAGDEDILVIDEGIHVGNTVELGKQVNRHDIIADGHIDTGGENTRKTDTVKVEETEDLHITLTHVYHLLVNLEIVHTDNIIPEIDGKETVNIAAYLLRGKESASLNALVGHQVIDLMDLDEEVFPLVSIITENGGLLALLGDDKIGGQVGIFTTIEETEIAVGEIMSCGIAVIDLGILLHVEGLADEDILLMNGIALAESTHNTGHQGGELYIAAFISGILLDGVLHGQHGTVLTSLGEDNSNAIDIFDGEIDILEDLCSLDTRTEGIDAHGHADKNAGYTQYDDESKHLTRTLEIYGKRFLKTVVPFVDNEQPTVDLLGIKPHVLLDKDGHTTDTETYGSQDQGGEESCHKEHNDETHQR